MAFFEFFQYFGYVIMEKLRLDSLWYEGGDSEEKYLYYDKEEYECDNEVSDELVESIENDLGFIIAQILYLFDEAA